MPRMQPPPDCTCEPNLEEVNRGIRYGKSKEGFEEDAPQ